MFNKKNGKTLIFLFLASALSGCASNSGRNPSSAVDLNLTQIINAVKNTSGLQINNPKECKIIFDNLYQRLFNLAGDTTYLDLNDQKSIDRDIENSFLARIALKDTFKNYNIDNECISSAMDVFKGLRYVEDYLIEIRMEKFNNLTSEYVNLKGEFPYLLVNPKYAADFKSYEDLKSGDIILSRGNAFSSAAIARIGSNDYQFSHLSFVYKNLESQELFTTEAHIEIGSVVAPLSEHIESKNSREMVFRYNGDADISARASKLMYDKVSARQQQKNNIEYDFAMDYKDEKRIFCSEVVSLGFKKALPDEEYFPKFKSSLSPGTLPFLNSIGLQATKENISEVKVFAPGDIQFDPRFEIVAEWRNPRKMEESRLKDFILTALFDRMDKEGYKFDPSLKMDIQARTFWLLRRLPIVKKFLQNKFALNMNPNQMELFMALDKVGDSIYKEIEKSSLEYERPMTPKEIYAAVDVFFKRDFELYKRYKKGQEVTKPAFHLLFHP